MNTLLTIAPLGLAGLAVSAVVATQSPFAFAQDDGGSRGEGTPAVVRVDDRGRDHAEDGPHHARYRAQDDHGREDHGFGDRGRHHAEDRRHHVRHDGADDRWDDHGRDGGRDDRRHHVRHGEHDDDGHHGGHGGDDDGRHGGHGGHGGDDD